jgi:hypothetical protein
VQQRYVSNGFQADLAAKFFEPSRQGESLPLSRR